MIVFKSKVYTAFELVVLKVCVMCVGLIIGAYLAPYVKRFLWPLAVLGAVAYLRAMYYYWSSKTDYSGSQTGRIE